MGFILPSETRQYYPQGFVWWGAETLSEIVTTNVVTFIQSNRMINVRALVSREVVGGAKQLACQLDCSISNQETHCRWSPHGLV